MVLDSKMLENNSQDLGDSMNDRDITSDDDVVLDEVKPEISSKLSPSKNKKDETPLETPTTDGNDSSFIFNPAMHTFKEYKAEKLKRSQ